nr:hypothetical protein [Aminiphilus sp.]
MGQTQDQVPLLERIDPAADADAVDATADALAGLCLYPRNEVQIVATNLVTA